MIKEIIGKLVEGQNLTEDEAGSVMNEIMSGLCTDAQISSFITALRIKGETIDEIAGCAGVMRDKAVAINVGKKRFSLVDTCGTGGDSSGTFNISTTTAFVVAGADIPVAKHGNKSVSSKCGSADVLEALGINIQIEPKKVERCIEEVGIGFLFAPLLHGAMKFAIGPRRQIGIRTIFNILGPLTNPARADAQLLGVFSPLLTEPLAEVLGRLQVKYAFVVHGTDGLDEITLTGDTRISELSEGDVETYTIKPEDFGFKRAKIDDIKGGDSKRNGTILTEVLSGKKGPHRDIVLLNAGIAIACGMREKKQDADRMDLFKECIGLASKSIDSGKAMEKLEFLKKITNSTE